MNLDIYNIMMRKNTFDELWLIYCGFTTDPKNLGIIYRYAYTTSNINILKNNWAPSAIFLKIIICKYNMISIRCKFFQ